MTAKTTRARAKNTPAKTRLRDTKKMRETSKKTLKALLKQGQSHQFGDRFTSFWRKLGRVIRYGVASFFRNAWLSLAATIIMIVTLAVGATALLARNISADIINNIENEVDMSIYLKQGTSRSTVDTIVADLESFASVNEVRVTSPEEAFREFASQHLDDPGMMAAINEATNQFFWFVNIQVEDITDTRELETYVGENELVRSSLEPSEPPSFISEQREQIAWIGKITDVIEKICIGAGIVFVVISILIIFNTIQMTIFNRKDEIRMMKLVGASKSFIRGPFLIEATLYGVIAAIVTFGMMMSGWTLVIKFAEDMDLIGAFYGTNVWLHDNWLLALFGLLVSGVLIGVVSSSLAARKYLKRI